jgi:hypothetical protein
MQIDSFRIVNPDRYDIATEVLSSAIRVLQAVGFSEEEIPKLFEQASNKRARGPLWIEPIEVVDARHKAGHDECGRNSQRETAD